VFDLTVPPTAEWIWWLARAALLAGALLVFAWALLAQRREFARSFAAQTVAIERSQAQLADLTERVAALGTALATMAQQAEATRNSPASPPRSAPAKGGYEMAIRLARSGATVEELVASSGATRSEAELLRRLHGGEQSRSGRDASHRSLAARA
jgi:uncharacterized coiled-coil protein SlyX